MKLRHFKNAFKLFSFLTIILTVFISCDKEVIKIKGRIDNPVTNQFVLKIKGLSGENERILDTIKCVNGEINFKIKAIKPPAKLTLFFNDNFKSDIWVGEYGTKTIEGICQQQLECKVLGSFFYDELQRILATYNKMYLESVKDKRTDLQVFNLRIENGEELTENEQKLKSEFEKALKTAKRLRKKSILKTVRKNQETPFLWA